MTRYEIPYGSGKLTFELPLNYSVDWIEPEYVSPAPAPLEVVREALARPVDGRPIGSFGSIHSVAIAVNDKTRPVPHQHLLPPLMDEIRAAGITDDGVRFLIATGTHLPMPESEFPLILPQEIIRRYEIISHNCDDEDNLVPQAKTSRGTPVFVNRYFAEADLRIVVGNIEPHHFAGFSGGAKTAAIGLTSRKTINHNHAMLADPGSQIAEYDRNPLRQDIEEIGDVIDIHFALNAVLNGDKKIVKAVSGSPRQVMKAGIPISQAFCQIPGTGRYDLVIASVGGSPKDINFYQSQKALSHASLFTRDGGVIILVAACPEGSGSESYERFMTGVTSPKAVIEKFSREGFRVGPHKAFQVAREAARVHIILVSEMPASQVEGLLMTPALSIETALSQGFHLLSTVDPEQRRVAVLPRATNTVPV